MARRTRNPFRWRTWLALVVLCCLAFWQVYHLGSQRGALHVGDHLDDRAALLATQDRSFVVLDQQSRRLRELQVQLDTQRKLTDLEVQAGLEMQKELQVVLLQKHQLLEQVQFYENIVGAEASKAGIRVVSLRLRPGESVREWWLQVTLAQVKKHNVRATGKVKVALYGQQNGTPVELTLSELHPSGRAFEKFGYRYFQLMSIPLVLPETFTPQELAVEVQVVQPKPSQLIAQREWVELQR